MALFFLFANYCILTTFTKMSKVKIIPKMTIKVTEVTVKNLNIAAAISGKKQYEVAEEGSEFVLGKYMSKSKR